jgi:hypothetical protein
VRELIKKLPIDIAFVAALALVFGPFLVTVARATSAPLSLEQLILDADAIFVGKATPVEKFRGHQPTLGGLPARLTRFEILEAFKGKPQTVKYFFVKQFPVHSTPVDLGETVLWYMKDGSADKLFSSPIGGSSGDFRRVSDESDSTQFLVMNYDENKGLWSNRDDGKLWNTTTFKRNIAQEYLDTYLPKHYSSLAGDPKKLGQRESEILNIGELPCRSRAIPIELLLAATHARLAAK